jgi:hydroxymethylbilane synthase
MFSKITLASRKSNLALCQTNQVIQQLQTINQNIAININKIDTPTPSTFDAMGLKGVFTKAIDHAVLNSNADAAVHSGKDLPSVLDDNICIAAVLKREECNDVFLSSKYQHLADCPKGSTIGTSSLRRIMFLQQSYPHLNVEMLRGNIDTRINALNRFDGIILAAAGIKRLQLTQHIKEYLDHDTFIPAASQGAIIVTCKKNNPSLIHFIEKINDSQTRLCVETERAICAGLSLDCHAPIGVYASIENNSIIHVRISLLWENRFIQMKQSGQVDQQDVLISEIVNKIDRERGV